MDGGMEEFCFESDIKDVKKIKLEDDNREIQTVRPNEATVKSETKPSDKNVCFLCNQEFDQFELELHFLQCSQDQDESDLAENTEDASTIQSDNQEPNTARENINLFQCNLCVKDFAKENDLKSHQKIHSKGTHTLYKCQVCLQAFKSMNILLNHQRTHSKEIHLQSHERTYTEKRPYKCQVCLKAFKTRNYLLKHEISHTKEMPVQTTPQRHTQFRKGHPCSQKPLSISSETSQPSALVSYAGARVLKCLVCLTNFSDPSALKKHLSFHENIHTNEMHVQTRPQRDTQFRKGDIGSALQEVKQGKRLDSKIQCYLQMNE